MYKINKIRIAFIIALSTIAVIIGAVGDTEIKAPTLTLRGGLIALVSLIPKGKPTVENFGIMAGMLSATAGSYFWLVDASSPEDGVTFILLILYGVIMFAFPVWFLTTPIEEAYKFIRSLLSRRRSRDK